MAKTALFAPPTVNEAAVGVLAAANRPVGEEDSTPAELTVTVPPAVVEKTLPKARSWVLASAIAV